LIFILTRRAEKKRNPVFSRFTMKNSFSPNPLSSSRFKTIKVLGQGSFGTAFLVEDSESFANSSNNKYVIKKIDISRLDAKAKAAALGEVEVLSRLSHPNIVAYYGSWIEGEPNHLHILLEYCDSGDLSQAIRDRKDSLDYFDEQQITSWFVQLSSAILFCHRMRILHRDLKTSNIFLHGPNKVVKLADFGIARVLQSEGSLASTVIGTPYYMSPELVNNELYSYKSDVWALGCVLYEMATLKHAFDAGNMCALVMSILRGKYTPLSQNQYSSRLAALIDSMLQLEPSRRPTMEEVLATSFVQEALVFAIQSEEGTGRLHVARAHSALAAVPDTTDDKPSSNSQFQEGEEEVVEEEVNEVEETLDVKTVTDNVVDVKVLPSDESTLQISEDSVQKSLNNSFFDETTFWSVGSTTLDQSIWARPRHASLQNLPNLKIDVTHTGRLDNKIKPPSLERFVHNSIRKAMPVHKACTEHEFPPEEMNYFNKRLLELQEAESAKYAAAAAASITNDDDHLGNEGWGSTFSGGDGEQSSSRSTTTEGPEMLFPKVPYGVSYPTSSLSTKSDIQVAMESIKKQLTSSNDVARVFMFVASQDLNSSTISDEDRDAILAARAAIKSNVLNKDDVMEILSSMPEYASLITPAILQERIDAREEVKRLRTERTIANMLEQSRETIRQVAKLAKEPAVILNERSEFFLSSPPRPRGSRNYFDEEQEPSPLAKVEEPILVEAEKPVAILPTLVSLEPFVHISPSLHPVTVLGRGRRPKASLSIQIGDHHQQQQQHQPISDIPPSSSTTQTLLDNINNLRASMIAATLIMEGQTVESSLSPPIDKKDDQAESTMSQKESEHTQTGSGESRTAFSASSDQLVRSASEEQRFWLGVREVTGVSRDSAQSKTSPRLCNEARALMDDMIEEEITSAQEQNESPPLSNNPSSLPESVTIEDPPLLPRLVTILTLPEEPVTLPPINSITQNRQSNVFSAAASSRSRSRSPSGIDRSGARSSLLKPTPAPRRTSLAGVAWTTAQSELASAATHLQIATNLREMVASTTTAPTLLGAPLPSSQLTNKANESLMQQPLFLTPSAQSFSVGLSLEPAIDEINRRSFLSLLNRTKPRRHSTGSSFQAQITSSSLSSVVPSIIRINPSMSSHTEKDDDDDDDEEEEDQEEDNDEASRIDTTRTTSGETLSLQFDEVNDRKKRMNVMRERCIRELGGLEKFDEIISTLRTVMREQDEEDITDDDDAQGNKDKVDVKVSTERSSKVLEHLIAKHGPLLMARLAQLQNQEGF